MCSIGSIGQLVAIFEVDILPTNVSNAVSLILSNPNAISGLKVVSVNMNSRSYEVTTPTQSTTQTNNELNLPGIIVGIIAACLVIIALIGYFIYRKIQSNTGVESLNNEEGFQRIDETINENSEYFTPSNSSSNPSQPQLEPPTIVEDIE